MKIQKNFLKFSLPFCTPYALRITSLISKTICFSDRNEFGSKEFNLVNNTNFPKLFQAYFGDAKNAVLVFINKSGIFP